MTSEKIRIDKWLWSIRIFKTRTLAAEEIKSNKVKINDINAKPAALVTVGDTVTVKKSGFSMIYRVVKLIEMRVAAPLAIECYEDLTPQAELDKYKNWFSGKTGAEIRERGTGRPTKKDRREIDDFKIL